MLCCYYPKKATMEIRQGGWGAPVCFSFPTNSQCVCLFVFLLGGGLPMAAVVPLQ